MVKYRYLSIVEPLYRFFNSILKKGFFCKGVPPNLPVKLRFQESLTDIAFSIRILSLKSYAPLAQRIRAFGCGPKGRAFESHKGHQ